MDGFIWIFTSHSTTETHFRCFRYCRFCQAHDHLHAHQSTNHSARLTCCGRFFLGNHALYRRFYVSFRFVPARNPVKLGSIAVASLIGSRMLNFYLFLFLFFSLCFFSSPFPWMLHHFSLPRWM
ncbi:hypothetical protein DM02DRAFT_5426 [Periconia macrospinosa]|uniref:Uncharacterized protein n=1 Tax=Periconia macrospinosa TaxID=97972 RepID=A0A2V1EER1_9PLEO|nr:hypothetical protein DM02DRAFT_5426 [Periconia macrospinosa]